MLLEEVFTSVVKRVTSSFHTKLRANVFTEYSVKIVIKITGSNVEENLCLLRFNIKVQTTTEKPKSGIKTNRSFINVPTLKNRLEVAEKVMIKKSIPKDIRFFFFNFLIA